MSPTLSTVDAHRRLQPFTAAGTLLRQIVPRPADTHPELVRAHDIEILAAAPELATLLTCRAGDPHVTGVTRVADPVLPVRPDRPDRTRARRPAAGRARRPRPPHARRHARR